MHIGSGIDPLRNVCHPQRRTWRIDSMRCWAQNVDDPALPINWRARRPPNRHGQAITEMATFFRYVIAGTPAPALKALVREQ